MREKPSRRIASGYKLVFGYLGIFITMIGIINLLPLLVIPFLKFIAGGTALDHASMWYAFAIPGLSSIVVGQVLYFALIFKREKGGMEKDQDAVLVLLVWLSAILICGIPFALSNEFTYLAGIFEAMSGLSTCGYTIFGESTLDPTVFLGYPLFMIHRSMLHLFGGIGLILIVSSVISGKAGLNIYQSEGHSDKLLPNLKRTARLILGLYLIYITIGIGLFLACGMSFFDAFNHSISAVATGGFSTHSDSIAYFSSDAFVNGTIPYGGHATFNGAGIMIEIVSLFLMLMGSSNFVLVFNLFRGKIKDFIHDIEVVFALSFMIIGILCYTFILKNQFVAIVDGNSVTLNMGQSFRYGIYTFISMFTTTGLSNIPKAFTSFYFNCLLASPAYIIMLLIVIVGNGIESTSGGIKQYRIATVFCGFYWTIKKRIGRKNRVASHQIFRLGKYKELSDAEILESYTFIGKYLIFLLLPAFIICWICNNRSGLSWFDFAGGNAISRLIYEYAGALGCTGFGCGILSYGDPSINPFIMIILIFSMLLGRLEIHPVFSGISRGSKDIYNGIKKIIIRDKEEITYVD